MEQTVTLDCFQFSLCGQHATAAPCIWRRRLHSCSVLVISAQPSIPCLSHLSDFSQSPPPRLSPARSLSLLPRVESTAILLKNSCGNKLLKERHDVFCAHLLFSAHPSNSAVTDEHSLARLHAYRLSNLLGSRDSQRAHGEHPRSLSGQGGVSRRAAPDVVRRQGCRGRGGRLGPCVTDFGRSRDVTAKDGSDQG